MREDRFFTGILIGIGVLVLIALVVFFTRSTTVQYVSDGSAAGVVQDYLTAMYARDYERAYGFVAESQEKVSWEIFRQEAEAALSERIDKTTVDVGAEEISALGDTAVVPITILSGGGVLDGTGRSQQPVNLVRQNGEWKISWAPDPFWIYGWAGQPTPGILPTNTDTP